MRIRRRYLALVLTGSLFLFFPGHVLAHPQKDDASTVEKIKTKIARLGVGEKARAQIKLRNGQKIKGYVSKAGDNDFSLTDRKSAQVTTIAYADVASVTKPGMSKRTKIIIGVTIGVVATAAILAWEVTHNFPNFTLSNTR
jgi:xanthine/uracil permease